MSDANKVIFKINDFKLESVQLNDLLNVSVLKVQMYNLAENLNFEKKLIVQFLKDKGELYKNII